MKRLRILETRPKRKTAALVLAATLLFTASAATLHAQKYTDLYNLGSNSGDAANPAWMGLFAQGRDGNLYSTSQGGGVPVKGVQYGAVFQLTPIGNMVVLYSFQNKADGVRYVESHDHAIRLKAEIMVDHFHEQVLAAGKIGGQARAMVVTSGIERAIQYFHAAKTYLAERKSPYQAIVAFSGEHDYAGARVSEVSLNGFSSGDIPSKIQTGPVPLSRRRPARAGGTT
jgi:hypothetical protein